MTRKPVRRFRILVTIFLRRMAIAHSPSALPTPIEPQRLRLESNPRGNDAFNRLSNNSERGSRAEGQLRATGPKQTGFQLPISPQSIDSRKMPPPPSKRSEVEYLETPVPSDGEPHRTMMVINHDSSEQSSSWPQDIWLHDQFCRVLYQPVLVFPLSQTPGTPSTPVYNDQDRAQPGQTTKMHRSAEQQMRTEKPQTEAQSTPVSLRPIQWPALEAPMPARKAIDTDSFPNPIRNTRPLAETRDPNEKMRRN